LPPACTRGGAI